MTATTALIGREQSIAEAVTLLSRDDVRLLTITGPGGIGKTRLAEAVAAAAGDRFADGVVLVPLQAVDDPGLVVGTVARSVGLFDFEGDLSQRIVDHLRDSRMLLLVDNFEQVVGAAPSLAAIVSSSPGLKAVVTSRTRLRVGGEQELPLEPLARDDAVHVFIERARAVRPDFAPNEPDLEAIGEICDHLDCLPLAIELAAPRVKVLSPQTMLTRLEHPLELLTSGSQDAPQRHRALRDTIGWSVELLDDDGRTLFRRLSVFAGGCTLDEVEEVCGGTIDGLGALVDASLVRSDGERFAMLETIREYAAELLRASGEADEIRRTHARACLQLTRTAATALGGPDQRRWRARLAVEHDNVRAALRFTIDDGDADSALGLCLALWRFWLERGYLGEGRLWLDEALALGTEPTAARARALTANGVLSHYQADYHAAEELSREALDLSRSLDDPTSLAEALTGLALVRRARGAYDDAEAHYLEALAIYDELGDEEATARTLDRLAIALAIGAQEARARDLFERSLALFRRLDDATGVAFGLHGLVMARAPGNPALARVQIDEALEILRGLGDRRNVAKVLWSAADVALEQGELEAAAVYLAEPLTLMVEFGDRWFCGVLLESAAELALAGGDAERATRLLGAAEGVWETIGAPRPTFLRTRHDAVVAAIERALDPGLLEAAREDGRRLPLNATVELVSGTRPAPSADVPEGLTARETEVLALVADGCSDAEVAERLVVSLRTVHAHLRSIYRKLDVHSRSAATRYALEHGLAA